MQAPSYSSDRRTVERDASGRRASDWMAATPAECERLSGALRQDDAGSSRRAAVEANIDRALTWSGAKASRSCAFQRGVL